jgi:prophage regulatory protein
MNNAADGYLRLPQVLGLFPVSRSTWWAGVRTGKFPRPFKLTARTTAWRKADILELIARTEAGDRLPDRGAR